MRCDAVVVGAGLAGLSAARDLAAAGTDVVALEARGRAGGRVEQTKLPDGRLVQLGGELIGDFHTAYRELVDELGLTIVPGFGDSSSGEDVALLAEGRVVGNEWPWLSDSDRSSYEQAQSQFERLAAGVDPEDPWSHPEAERLDAVSVGEWMRSVGPRLTPSAPASSRCCRSPPSRSSGPRCWPTCARRPRREGAASTTTRSGSRG
jgi:monoamine oxidase